MSENDTETPDLEEIGHPKGTLAIVALYAAMFIVGWILLFATQFVPRGTPQPGIGDTPAEVCDTVTDAATESITE